MEKLEKVIKGLECCLPMTTRNGFADCKQCPYDRKITLEGGVIECCHDLMADALALLKAQEPRVMTLDEAKDAFVVEYRSGKMREFGSALLDLDVDPLNAEYGKIYRVWTSRPDEKRRAETPWE